MQVDETEEEAIVVEAHALIYPHTVVVHFLNALVAAGAVLGTRWFLKLACLALDFLLKHNPIVLEALHSCNNILAF